MRYRFTVVFLACAAVPATAGAQDMPVPERTGADYAYAQAATAGDAPGTVYMPVPAQYPQPYPQAYPTAYPPPGAEVIYPGMPGYEAAYAQATGGATEAHYTAQRDAWLAECRARFVGHDGRHRDGALGALIGAGVGGLVGNRIADGDRLLGTAIGAGVGGIAGAAIANQRSHVRTRTDECERYLADWERSGPAGRPVHYVPVMVPVPQRAVMREEPVDEWIEAPTSIAPRMRAAPARRVPVPRAPARRPGDKRIPLGN